MTYRNEALSALAVQFSRGGIFADWLNGALPALGDSGALVGATSETQASLAAAGPNSMAPLWLDPDFASLLPTAMRNLPHGPSVVVTGQQPGLLGGPLLTVYKIATAIKLARRRTETGFPTVPVFWSGDDDDDLAEALAPVGW